MRKLIIQIPCYNEAETIVTALAGLPGTDLRNKGSDNAYLWFIYYF